MTAAELNRMNNEFWTPHNERFMRQIEKPVLLAHTIRFLEGESFLPVYSQKTYENVLDTFERFDADSQKERGRKGGQTKKSDPLQEFTDAAVKANPKISTRQLLKMLKTRDLDFIHDITGDQIYYYHAGIVKEASVGGIKDRLSRARKKLSPSR